MHINVFYKISYIQIFLSLYDTLLFYSKHCNTKKHNSRSKNINHEGNQPTITHKNPPNNYHVQNLSGSSPPFRFISELFRN